MNMSNKTFSARDFAMSAAMCQRMANVKMKRVPCGEEKLKISNDQELVQSESNAHPKTQKGNDQKHTVSRTSNYFPKGCHSVTCMNAHTKGAQIK